MQFGLKAPRVHHYISCLSYRGIGSIDSARTYDKLSYEKIDELFTVMSRLEPCGDRGVRKIWVPVDRGTIEDFGDYERMLEDGDVDNYEQYENWWHDECPDETEWVLIGTLDDKQINYRAVFINRKLAIEVNPRQKRSELMEYDIHEFTCWLVEAATWAIEKVSAEIYNSEINAKLPAKHRVGTILRSDTWAVWPEAKDELFKNLSQKEVDYFLHNAVSDRTQIDKRLPAMTASDFYRFCAMGYKVNNYPGTEKSPKEQYYLHADGRDDGLAEIDPDSLEAFHHWLNDPTNRSGHPWEVCRGGNSTHVSLMVWDDKDGYLLSLDGSSIGRCVETIKFFNVLHQAGLPVVIYDAEKLCRRLLGTELIGIVPEGIIPVYCNSYFKEDIIAFMNLPDENTEEFVKRINWYPLEEVRLKETLDRGEA